MGIETPIYRALRRALHSRGRGTTKRVNEGLGWPPRSIYKYMHRGLKVRELLLILRQAGIPPVTFFSEVFGSATARHRFEEEARVLATKRHELIPNLSPPTKNQRRDKITAAELLQIDDLLHLDPKSVVNATSELATVAVSEGRIHDAAALMARKALGLRLLLEFHGAHTCAGWALPRLAPRDLPHGLLVAARLTMDYGDMFDACELASEAIVAAAHENDSTMISRSQVVRSLALKSTDNACSAIRGIQSAITRIRRKRTDSRTIAFAYRNLAKVLFLEGDNAGATKALEHAELYETPPGIPAGESAWLRAMIANTSRNIEDTIRHYQDALVELRPSPGDLVLASCKLVRILKECGKKEQAIEVCKSLASTIEMTACEDFRTTITALINAALAKDITEGILIETCARVSRIRTPLRPAMKRQAPAVITTDSNSF